MELNIIWFILLIVLFSGYVVLDGFDLGVGMLHFKAKTDDERRILLNSIGPVWDGNEVWLITAGGALFAAFPNVYATVFSGFYTAFMLFLLVLIGRAVSIEFRSKVENPKWRITWDVVFHISSYLIAILLGVTLGNLIAGVPITTIDGVKEFDGSFLGLLNPYSIFLGCTAAIALRFHGSLYLLMKTSGELKERIEKRVKFLMILFIMFLALLTIWTWFANSHHTENFLYNPIWFIFPLLIIISFILIPKFLNKQKYFTGFVFSSLILVSCIVITEIGLYPNLLYSNTNPLNSLNIFEDASSQKTLMVMLIIALIGVPLMLIYKFFVYRIFKGKVQIDSNSY